MADNKVNSGLLEFSEDQKVFVALDAETSEVIKAVTIDGDGVETDIGGGGGGGVTVEALNVTENGTYSEEGKAYSPVVVEVESGASDFDIAEVRVNVTGSPSNLIIVIPALYDGDVWGYGTQGDTYRVVVPKNKATVVGVFGQNIESVTATGDIVVDSNDEIYITGAGTINIAGGTID